MNERKALEKLRKNLKDCTTESGVEPNKFDTYWITADACDKLINDVEAEIAERYMLLPVDADGVPIHIGDIVEGQPLGCSRVKGSVTTYYIHDNDEPDSIYIKVDCGNGTWTIRELRTGLCHHVKPRTLEGEQRVNDKSDKTSELVNDENYISASFELCDIYNSNEEEINEPEIIDLDY